MNGKEANKPSMLILNLLKNTGRKLITSNLLYSYQSIIGLTRI